MNVRPLLLASLLVSGGAALPAVAEEFALLTEARTAASSLPPRLVSALNEEIAKGGPEGAIPVCRDMAPRMAKEVAASTGGELVEQADGKRVYRYAKALPTQPLCLNCHGAQEKLTPAVRARLAEHYPDDRATGYSEGQIRGAIVASKPL